MIRRIICITIVTLSLVIGGCSSNTSSTNESNEVHNNQSSEEKRPNEIEASKEVESKDNNQIENDEIKKEDTTITTNEEIKTEKKKTIVIDPGHSSIGDFEKESVSPDSSETKYKDVLGAQGAYSNTPEYEITLAIGLKLRDILSEKGYEVIMTKEEVSQSISNIERAEVGNTNSADLVIRLHADGSDDNSVKGASILVPNENKHTLDIYETSLSYGKTIIDEYSKEVDFNNRCVIERGDMTGFNWSDVPVVLLEMGFLSNEEDDIFLSNESNHESIAKAISIGIDKCFD